MAFELSLPLALGVRLDVGHGGFHDAWRHAELHSVYPPRASYIFENLLSHVIENEIEPVANRIMNDCGDADTARLGQGLQTRRDIHPITVDFTVLDDDVIKIDPYPENDPLFLGRPGVPVSHCELNFNSAGDGFDNALKFDQETITCGSYDSTLVFDNFGPDELAMMFLEQRDGAEFVFPH
jgi:hypothetical protein